MLSAEKKRLRDRRAQQTFRTKRVQQIIELKEQVAYCEQHHDDQGTQQLLQTIQSLREQNAVLIQRQERLRSLILAWDDDYPVNLPTGNFPGVGQTSQEEVIQGALNYREENLLRPPVSADTNPDSMGSINVNEPSGLLNSTPMSASAPPVAQSSVSSPAAVLTSPMPGQCLPWKLLPLNDDDFSSSESISLPWFAYPQRIASSADSPLSPLDFLYGTRENFLSDMIHMVIRRRPLRDPERLAIGWTAYHLTKWLFSPGPTTYARLPEFSRPILGQTQIPHPMALDFIPWPKVRLNLIQRWHVYRERRDELFGMLAICVKVRWPWGENILERNERNELCIRQSFYDTFMSESGWGLTSEFINKYPDLVAGADLASIIYEVI
ncbi:hypothetical protein DTO166G4_8777 [Paecilomyces variotii]|nr:hypothetical protein DTO166G4_8777 [Paecilomyces variotii]KAJ9233808.1 hypothetical protein DTO166G5_5564 [Paecilomyces variotii]